MHVPLRLRGVRTLAIVHGERGALVLDEDAGVFPELRPQSRPPRCSDRTVSKLMPATFPGIAYRNSRFRRARRRRQNFSGAEKWPSTAASSRRPVTIASAPSRCRALHGEESTGRQAPAPNPELRERDQGAIEIEEQGSPTGQSHWQLHPNGRLRVYGLVRAEPSMRTRRRRQPRVQLQISRVTVQIQTRLQRRGSLAPSDAAGPTVPRALSSFQTHLDLQLHHAVCFKADPENRPDPLDPGSRRR